MATIYKVGQCPVFKEAGDIKLTAPYGAKIPDYPQKGKMGDHWGCDIVRSTDGKNSTTATIVAIADGIIYAQRKWVKAFDASVSAGNCVYIRHADGTVTKYMHLKYGTMPDWIKDNVPVKKGDVLGYMGSTGNSYGAHLHFQVEDANEKTVDPLPYLLGEKVIGKSASYGVKLSEKYDTEAAAQKVAEALNTLGIKSEVEKA